MSTEAQMLGEMATGVLRKSQSEGETGDPWQPMVEGGWIGVGIDEELGGAGGTLQEAAALAEASGVVGSSHPVTETIAAAITLAAAHGGAERLAELNTGSQRAVLACGVAAAWTPGRAGKVTVATDGWSIPFADHCSHVVIPLSSDAGTAAVGVIGLDELTVQARTNIAGEPRATVVSKHVAVKPMIVSGGPAILEAPIAVLGAARLVGAMRTVQSMSVDYANSRRQFGRPIGSFQAIAHALVAQVRELAQATAAVDMAAQSTDLPMLGYAARVIAARAARPVAEIAHQVHGAIGTTHEHDLHRFTLRLLAWRLELGRPRVWCARLGDCLAAEPSSWWTGVDQASAGRSQVAAV